jgi:hypothetical protein
MSDRNVERILSKHGGFIHDSNTTKHGGCIDPDHFHMKNRGWIPPDQRRADKIPLCTEPHFLSLGQTKEDPNDIVIGYHEHEDNKDREPYLVRHLLFPSTHRFSND